MQNILLSERIKKQCKLCNVAIKTLLEECNMNRNTIYDLEKKGSFPSSDKISHIADYLHCSVDYLLGRSDEVDNNVTTNDENSVIRYQINELITKYANEKGDLLSLYKVIEKEVNAQTQRNADRKNEIAELLKPDTQKAAEE